MNFKSEQKSVENTLETKKISSFETAKGSVYTYLPDGKIQRLKTETGETFIQNVIAFIPDRDWFEKNVPEDFIKKVGSFDDFQQEMLKYCRDKSGKLHVCIIDEMGNKIETVEKLKNASNVFLYFGHDDIADYVIPISKIPQINYSPFDTSKYEEKEKWFRRSHIGNKIIKINYEN